MLGMISSVSVVYLCSFPLQMTQRRMLLRVWISCRSTVRRVVFSFCPFGLRGFCSIIGIFVP